VRSDGGERGNGDQGQAFHSFFLLPRRSRRFYEARCPPDERGAELVHSL
jgi:hypothetical protein